MSSNGFPTNGELLVCEAGATKMEVDYCLLQRCPSGCDRQQLKFQGQVLQKKVAR